MIKFRQYILFSYLTSTILVIALIVIGGVHFSSIVKQDYIHLLDERIIAQSSIAQGLVVHQNIFVKNGSKSLEKAQRDFAFEIESSAPSVENRTGNFLVLIVDGNEHFSSLYYSGSTNPPDPFYQEITKKFDYKAYKMGDSPLASTDKFHLATKGFSPWKLIIVNGIDQKFIAQEVRKRIIYLAISLIILSIISISVVSVIFLHIYKVCLAVHGNAIREQLLFNHHPEFLIMLDRDGKILEVSKSLLDTLRKHLNTFIGETVWNTVWWGHSAISKEQIKFSLKKAISGEKSEFITAHPLLNGDILQVHHLIIPVFNSKKEVDYILDFGCTASKVKMDNNDQIAIIASNYFLSNVPEAIIIHGLESGIQFANLAALQLFSCVDMAELNGHHLSDFSDGYQITDEHSSSFLSELFAQAMALGILKQKWVIRDASGIDKNVELIIFRGNFVGENIVYIILRDISDHLEAIAVEEKKIKELEDTIKAQDELINTQSYDLNNALAEIDKMAISGEEQNNSWPQIELNKVISDAIQIAYENYNDYKFKLIQNIESDQNFFHERYHHKLKKLFKLISENSFSCMFADDRRVPSLIVEVKRAIPYNIIRFIDKRSVKDLPSDDFINELKAIAVSFDGALTHGFVTEEHYFEVALPIVSE